MLCLIVNPAARGGGTMRALPAVQAALRRQGCEYHLEVSSSLAHAGVLARAAAAAGELPVAFGGDGLVAAVAGATRERGAEAGAARGRGAVIGVLPGGRGNDLARCLGLPLDPVGATALLATGEPRWIDMGLVGERAFLGIASCGFDSEANRIANRTRWLHGRLVYAYAGVRALARWRPAGFTVVADGTRRELFGYTVAVANSRMHGGGMLLAPAASLDDGCFDVVMIAAVGKLRFLRLLPGVYRGAHVEAEEVTVLRARTVELAAERPFTLFADGEELATLPVTVRILPSAVGIMAPAARIPDRSETRR